MDRNNVDSESDGDDGQAEMEFQDKRGGGHHGDDMDEDEDNVLNYELTDE